MLDGRVLGASQVEYKPFGKPPLKREGAQMKCAAKLMHSQRRTYRPGKLFEQQILEFHPGLFRCPAEGLAVFVAFTERDTHA